MDKATPIVSVVIVTFNREVLLREAIASVLNQSFQEFELIIVDDGSTDSTRQFLSECDDKRMRTILQIHCGHLPKLRNIGLSAARGKFIALLDSDDRWHPEKLATQVEAIKTHRAGFALCLAEHFNEQGVAHQPEFGFHEGILGYQPSSLLPLALAGKVPLQSSAFLFEKTLGVKVGGFNESLPTSDYDFAMRLIASARTVLDDRAFVQYRVHEGGMSALLENQVAAYQEGLNVLRHFLGTGDLSRKEYRRKTAAAHTELHKLYRTHDQPFRAVRHLSMALTAAPTAVCKALVRGMRNRIQARARITESP